MALSSLACLQESFHWLSILEVPLLTRLQTPTAKRQFAEQSEGRRPFSTLNHSSAYSQHCRPNYCSCRTAQLTHVHFCGSDRPQRRAEDISQREREMKYASLLRNLIFTLQLTVENSIFKVFLSGISS